MKKIAVFGKPGGGKSTLSKKISETLNIELYPLDLIEYKSTGNKVNSEEYNDAHNKLINKESWIIEGLGSLDSFWLRVDKSDTLIFIDLPYWQHYWFTTKRLVKSPFIKPEGWPEGSSVIKGTLQSWKYLKLSRKFWNNDFLIKIKNRAVGKNIFHIKSKSDLNSFIKNLINEIIFS
jgi:adenylate kinase family enzyme